MVDTGNERLSMGLEQYLELLGGETTVARTTGRGIDRKWESSLRYTE
jgi:hypothetical protein